MRIQYQYQVCECDVCCTVPGNASTVNCTLKFTGLRFEKGALQQQTAHQQQQYIGVQQQQQHKTKQYRRLQPPKQKKKHQQTPHSTPYCSTPYLPDNDALP